MHGGVFLKDSVEPKEQERDRSYSSDDNWYFFPSLMFRLLITMSSYLLRNGGFPFVKWE